MWRGLTQEVLTRFATGAGMLPTISPLRVLARAWGCVPEDEVVVLCSAGLVALGQFGALPPEGGPVGLGHGFQEETAKCGCATLSALRAGKGEGGPVCRYVRAARGSE